MRKTTAPTLTLLAACSVLAPLQAAEAQRLPAQAAPSAQQVLEKYKGLVLPYVLSVHRPIDTNQAGAVQAASGSISLGEEKLKAGDADGAIAAFQQALSLEPHDGLALQRLAEAYTAKGQADQAIGTYRTLLYHIPGQRWSSSNETSPAVLMPFALLLQQTGRTQEAIAAFQRGLGFLNAGELSAPSVPVPAPGSGGIPDTLDGFRAAAHLALFVDTFGHEGYGDLEPLKHLQQALALAPDSAAANYYMGKYLYGKSDPGAKAYLQKAVDLGDDRTAAAAKIYLSILN
jgi:tetratricopeptide (TPR) repeat protein